MSEIRESLREIKRLDQTIDTKLSEIYQLKNMATSSTVPPKDVNVQTSTSGDRLCDTVSKIIDLEEETNSLVDRMCDLKRYFTDCMKELKFNDYYVLHEHYINGKSLYSIAKEQNVSYNAIKIRHGRALEKLQIILDNVNMK